MEILVYKADEIVPIKGLYEWLGDSGSIIFSNADQKIQNFESREVIRLLGSIHFDTVIFYIPLSIQNQFVKLVNSQFQITEWQKDNTVKFSIEDIGLIGKNVLYRFFDKMRLIVGLSPKKACSKKLKELLNKIVQENNSIDAVFVYNLTSDFMFCKNTLDNPVEIVPNVNYLGTLKEIRNICNDFGTITKCGKLEYTIFQLEYGILNLYIIEKPKDIVVGFIKLIPHHQESGTFLFQSNDSINDIEAELKKFFT
jgi:hypothetical protein